MNEENENLKSTTVNNGLPELNKDGLLTTSTLQFSDSNAYAYINQWLRPELIETKEVGESIEMVYKQRSSLHYTSNYPRPAEERVFKIIYSCIDGKWNKSEPIYGKLIPARDEYYEFEEEQESNIPTNG